jgi:hypothetical protein
VIVHALMELDPRFPVLDDEARRELLEIKRTLEAQAPKGAAADPYEEERREREAVAGGT